MRIVEVIGSVTLSRVHPSLIGARWLVGVPFSLEALKADKPDGEDLVIYDDLGAGIEEILDFFLDFIEQVRGRNDFHGEVGGHGPIVGLRIGLGDGRLGDKADIRGAHGIRLAGEQVAGVAGGDFSKPMTLGKRV